MPLPDFFVVGAPKAGTTALHAALARHPQLFMATVKEPKYFLCEGPPPIREARETLTATGSGSGAETTTRACSTGPPPV